VLKEGLEDKLACVLFQLPPQLSYAPDKLEKILSQVDPSFHNVIEFRNESWWRKDVWELLGRQGISFSGVSFPKIAQDDAVINTGLVYYRFHGVPKLFYSEYEPAFLERIFREIQGNPRVHTAYIYFNNTASLAALHNARQFMELVRNNQ
jgi:uncharacterized protein YecE (DUF72 family)